MCEKNMLFLNLIYGCFLKWWYPHFTPQVLIIFSRKTPMGLLGKPTILGNPHILKQLWNLPSATRFKSSPSQDTTGCVP